MKVLRGRKLGTSMNQHVSERSAHDIAAATALRACWFRPEDGPLSFVDSRHVLVSFLTISSPIVES